MSLWRRIKNLWAWSKIRPVIENQPNSGATPLLTDMKMDANYPSATAQIISYNRRNPIQELLEDSETI